MIKNIDGLFELLFQDRLTDCGKRRLQNCVTELNQENQQLKEQNECLLNQKKDFEYIQTKNLDYIAKKNKQLKQRDEVIDEAINYIDKNMNQKLYTGEQIFDTYSPATDLLEILQRYRGDNK